MRGDMNIHGAQVNPINNMNMPMTMNSAMQQNQMNPTAQLTAGQQMNPTQVSQMLNRLNTAGVNQSSQNVGNQINPTQMMNQINVAQAANIPVPQPQINPAMISNANIPASINQTNAPNQLQGANQMNLNPMMNMQHMARAQPANVMYQGSMLFKNSFYLGNKL